MTPKPVLSLTMASFVIFLLVACSDCNGRRQSGADQTSHKGDQSVINVDKCQSVTSMLLLPRNPVAGQSFRLLTVGSEGILKAKIIVRGPSGDITSSKTITGDECPYWRLDNFNGAPEGTYKITLLSGKRIEAALEFAIPGSAPKVNTAVVWETQRSWDVAAEAIYSAWVNALFNGCDEQASWSSLNEVTQNKEQNFLYNYLSLGEDDPGSRDKVVMQPDCADNPFFLRAYFAWKLGLPFGYHVCDRGYLGRHPQTGQWVTNETAASKKNSVQAFNSFLRRVMDGVHSGTARTSLDNNNSDYYPVALDRNSLRPGIVYADPYGHTLVIVGWIEQSKDHPGLLLAVDAQPDMTIAIKRFWKGNFLFNTTEVVGEPGFKAFRPIVQKDSRLTLLKNNELTDSTGFTAYSLQQRKMESSDFYHTMERIINPDPLDPEAALLNLIQALYEQLQVRVISVSNGEDYCKKHPGTIIPMPSRAAGIFQAGGMWENYSTPNRDLRLLIAMDAVLEFPGVVAGSPDDFKITSGSSPDKIIERLQSLMDKKTEELAVTYTRSDGSQQTLTVSEILKRRNSFEMAYNPNDGAEIRWGAPENSDEISTCKRHAPTYQSDIMKSVRPWFQKRLHPPT